MQVCDAADALTENGPNPHLIIGALIEMSTFADALPTSRLSNDSRVAPEYNAGFTGASAQPPPLPQQAMLTTGSSSRLPKCQFIVGGWP